MILTSVCLSRGVNLLLNLTALPKLFPGYEGISDGIYSCSLLSQIAASVVSASLLEEVLMRGLVYHRLKGILYNKKKALVGSALLFAVFHGNVLQGVYAFFLGLLFAWIFETYQSLLPAVIAHMAANAASIFFQKTGFSEALSGNPVMVCLLTAAFLLAGMFFLHRIQSTVC